MICLHF